MPKARDLNWILCNEELQLIYIVARLAPRNLIYSGMRFALGAFRSLAFLFRRRRPKKSEVIFFVSGENMYKAMIPVIKKSPQSSVIEIINPLSRRAHAFFPLHRVYCRALFNSIAVIKEYQETKNLYIKDVYKARGDLLAIAPSMLEVSISYLKFLNPKVVVVSNDFVLWDSAIIQAAKQLGIKSVYMQHSTVSKHVPPLNVDFAFLDGHDAALKYNAHKQTNSYGSQIYLTGGARHDAIFKLRPRSRSSQTIGLCLNMGDSIEAIRHTAHALSSNTNQTITIRPHPRESRISQLRLISKEVGARWSDPNNNSVTEFLENHDAVIAGDSSILLEAALCNRNAITYRRLGAFDDYTGAVKNNVIRSAKDHRELINMLTQPFQASASDLKKYSALHGSSHQGRSSELIASAIREIAECGHVNDEYWRKTATENIFHFRV